MRKTTEASSNYESLENMSTADLLSNINKEDKTVPLAIEKELPAIEAFVNACYERMKTGGRLFYIGAGTSGRLGIVDASECPPTFGLSMIRRRQASCLAEKQFQKAISKKFGGKNISLFFPKVWWYN